MFSVKTYFVPCFFHLFVFTLCCGRARMITACQRWPPSSQERRKLTQAYKRRDRTTDAKQEGDRHLDSPISDWNALQYPALASQLLLRTPLPTPVPTTADHFAHPRLPVSPVSLHGSNNRVCYEFPFPVNAPCRVTASTTLGAAMDHALLEDVVRPKPGVYILLTLNGHTPTVEQCVARRVRHAWLACLSK